MRWLFRREYLMVARSLRAPLPVIPDLPGLHWTELSAADLPALTALNPVLTLTEVRRRQHEGQRCLLCWSGERLVHYRWDARQTIYLPYLDRYVRLLPGDSIIVEVFTDREFRNRGINSAGAWTSVRWALEHGADRLIALIPRWNAPSFRTGQKAELGVVGTVGYWTIGFARRYFTSGSVRFDRSGAIVVSSGSADESMPSARLARRG